MFDPIILHFSTNLHICIESTKQNPPPKEWISGYIQIIGGIDSPVVRTNINELGNGL